MPEGNANIRSARVDATAQVVAIAEELLRESRPGAAPSKRIGADSDLERDLGLDSLSRAELLRRVEEEAGMQLPAHTLGDAETLADVARALAQGVPAARVSQLGPSPPLSTTAPAAREAGVALPEDATTLLDVLAHHARVTPDRRHVTLLHYSDATPAEECMTYGALAEESTRVAAALADHGLERGDRVALMLPTSRDFFVAFFGVIKAGGVPVPIYPPARRSQLEDHVRRQAGILGNCRARFLVSFPEAHAVGWLLRAAVDCLDAVLSVADLAVARDQRRELPAPDALALLQYTSGSTGEPKGVMLTHANVLANIRAMGAGVELSASDLFLSWLPLYHDMGLIGAWLGCLYYAVPLVVMSPLDFLARPERWLHAITRYRATLSAGPNSAYEMCATRIPDDRLEGIDLRSWRIAFNGAEPVVAETIDKFARRFSRHGYGPVAQMPVYGLAEAAVGLTFPPLHRGPRVDLLDRDAFARDGRALPARSDDTNPLRVVSCGCALPGYAVRVVGHAGEETLPRQEGRVEFRGPSATQGYFANPAATRALLRDGWLDTGDLGYLDDGELFLTGRAKDVIIRAGQHIHPQDAESRLGSLPGVRKGCVVVIGVPDARTGTEKLVVIAETRERDRSRRDALAATIEQLMVVLLGAPPDDIVLAAPHAVLKTSSGKLRRAACRDMYLHGMRAGERSAVWNARLRIVAAMLGKMSRRAIAALSRIGYGVYLSVLVLIGVVAAVPVLALVQPSQRCRRATAALARAVIRMSRLPFTLTGAAHLAGSGARVIVANHASYADAVLLASVLPEAYRFVAKQELGRYAPLRWALRRLGARFVERFDVEQSVGHAHELAHLARVGESLVFFAEGTFTAQAGLRPFRLGAFATAAGARAPVIPVAIRGTRHVLRDGQWLPRRAPVEIAILPPLVARGGDWGSIVRLRDDARAAIAAACGEPALDTAPMPRAGGGNRIDTAERDPEASS